MAARGIVGLGARKRFMWLRTPCRQNTFKSFAILFHFHQSKTVSVLTVSPRRVSGSRHRITVHQSVRQDPIDTIRKRYAYFRFRRGISKRFFFCCLVLVASRSHYVSYFNLMEYAKSFKSLNSIRKCFSCGGAWKSHVSLQIAKKERKKNANPSPRFQGATDNGMCSCTNTMKNGLCNPTRMHGKLWPNEIMWRTRLSWLIVGHADFIGTFEHWSAVNERHAVTSFRSSALNRIIRVFVECPDLGRVCSVSRALETSFARGKREQMRTIKTNEAVSKNGVFFFSWRDVARAFLHFHASIFFCLIALIPT